MKYSNLLILLLEILNINYNVKSQNPVEINIHLNEDIGSKSRFLLKYDFCGRGEKAIKNTVFEANIDTRGYALSEL